MIRVKVEFNGEDDGEMTKEYDCDHVVLSDVGQYVQLKEDVEDDDDVGSSSWSRTIAVIPLNSIKRVGYHYPARAHERKLRLDATEEVKEPKFEAQTLKTRTLPKQELQYNILNNTTLPRYVFVLCVGSKEAGVVKRLEGPDGVPKCFVDRTEAMHFAAETVPPGTHLDAAEMKRADYIEAAWTFGGTTVWLERLEVRG